MVKSSLYLSCCRSVPSSNQYYDVSTTLITEEYHTARDACIVKCRFCKEVMALLYHQDRVKMYMVKIQKFMVRKSKCV